MAYSRKSKKESNWKDVQNMNGFTVIGSPERFSISFEPFEGFRIGINGCKIIKGKKGDFISYPAWKDRDGNYHDYCYMTFSDEETKHIIDTLES